MANHSQIFLKKPTTPDSVELAVAEINGRRFQGRLLLSSSIKLTESWQASRAWLLQAPGTRLKQHKFCPDEDLGFCFWLHKEGSIIESRHTVFNSWVRWVQDIFEHELARFFKVSKFDGGDGKIITDPEQYGSSLFKWATRNFKHPLTRDDVEFFERQFTSHIPDGWE